MSYPFSIDTCSSLKQYSYSSTGGSCEGIVTPSSTDELIEAIKWMFCYNHRFYILGSGTNSVLSSLHYQGYVISLAKLNNIVIADQENTIIAQAGALNNHIVQFAYDHHLSSIEWMYGLPGQIGASARINAKCYGGQIQDHISQITSVDVNGDIKQYSGLLESPSSVFYGYKDTYFINHQEIIIELKLALKPIKNSHKRQEKLTIMKNCFNDRKQKQQFIYPSCGCVFKNDHSPFVSVSSGYLIDCTGVKGTLHKGAQISENHGNFIYNIDGSAESIIELSLIARDKVYQMFGVWMSYEMELLGDFDSRLLKLINEKKPFKPSAEQKKHLSEVRYQFSQRNKLR